MEDGIDIEKTYNHWIDTSDKDYITMINLYNSKDYHWSLFIGHIVLERLLKAAVVRNTSNHAPFTHDLTKLANISGQPFSDEWLDWMDTISTLTSMRDMIVIKRHSTGNAHLSLQPNG
jgi:HEPN domain-containing protein